MRYIVKISLKLMAIICLITCVSSNSQAFTGKLEIPADGITQKITLTDGSTLMGQITEITKNSIKFQTGLGEIPVALDKIKSIEEVTASKTTPPEPTTPTETPKTTTSSPTPTTPAEAPKTTTASPVPMTPAETPKTTAASPAPTASSRQTWYPNPNLTRLFIGPTSRTLKAGKGYFFDLWIFFPGVAYGITDHFMVSGGVSIIPGLDHQLFYIMPKYGFEASENLDLSLSVTAFSIWDKTFCFGLGGMTFGTDDQSITAALGLAFTDDKVSEKPAAMVGGEYRLGRRVSLVGEGWFIPGAGDNDETGILGMAGLRLMGEQTTIDFGVAIPNDPGDNDDEDEGGKWVPYLDFVWNF
jgi:hypothetical protein